MDTSVSTSHLWDIIDRVCITNLWMISHYRYPRSQVPQQQLSERLLPTPFHPPNIKHNNSSNTATPALLWLHGCAKWIHVCHTEPTLQYRLMAQTFSDHGTWLISIVEVVLLSLAVYKCRHITKSYPMFIPFHTIGVIGAYHCHYIVFGGTNCFHVGMGIGITNIPMIKLNHPTGNESQLTTPHCDCDTGW